MRLHSLCFTIFLAYPLFLVGTTTAQQAIVIVPVANLLGESQEIIGNQNVVSAHTNIPICGKKGPYACPRLHQLLFNEVVTIVEEYKDEVKVKVPHVFFETNNQSSPLNTYWTLKKNLVPLDQLKKHHINLEKIPEPISYQTKTIEPDQSIIILALPYHDRKTGMTFSAGTRFVKQQTQDNLTSISVYALDPQGKTMRTLRLPRTLCIAQKPLSKDQKIALFVELLTTWAHQHQGFIPYVWGGCSFATLCKNDKFTTQESKAFNGQKISFYQRIDSKKYHTGLDCTGLVMRATQLAGIPYFYKNTTTLSKYLKPMTNNTPIHSGDLIWFPGHVMVIGNLKKNTIIEARHYSHGYGKVHELPLKDVFKDVATFDELQENFFQHKPLLRLDKNGSVAQTITTFKILRLASVWE
jgi:cell wall-associated NlpC family hydrolase